MYMNSVTSRLFKYVRDKKMLNQKQLAVKLGINQSTVSRIENRLQTPRYGLIKKLSILTGISTQELIKEIQKNP